jgi:hypothetical protein
MSSEALTTEQILSMLAEAPPRLATLTAELSPAQLRTHPNPDEWSANDILAHLRSCADVWGNCITTILAEDRPTIRAINPRTWIDRTDYLELEFRPSLDAFTRQRTELLAVLKPLPPEVWLRSATVTGAGKVLERTVLSYAEWLATHERSHVKAVARLVRTISGSNSRT